MPSQAASVGDEPVIRDILAVSDGTLSVLLTREGFTVRNDENLGIIRDSWVNSQKSGPPFESWQLSWNEYKQTVDGDKDTPDNLSSKGKQQYLTVEEVTAFAKRNTHTTEALHGARQTHSPAGNRKKGAHARNNPGSPEGGYTNLGI